MKVSVITVNLNNLEGLKKTVASVLEQEYINLEYLVIDGASSDGSEKYLGNNSSNFFYWVSEKDSGVYEAMNKGILKATGDYLIFLNSGDYFYTSTSLKELVNHSQGKELVYGNLLIREEKLDRMKEYPKRLSFRYFYFESLPHPATLISKKLFDKIGLYDTRLRIVADWKFFLLAIAKFNSTYTHVDQVISVFNFDGLSSNPANLSMIKAERNTVFNKNFFFKFWIYKIYLLFKTTFKSKGNQ